jgi:hypothetical protein
MVFPHALLAFGVEIAKIVSPIVADFWARF